MSLTGRRVGVYEVQAAIGAGGMGVVYRALDTNLQRTVAIKFLSDEFANAGARRRFQREAQTASSLNHPHIVTVHDAGEYDGRQYLVTEFVDGGTLRDWTRAAARSWRQTIDLLIGVADAIAAAHEVGILHRDIKPENILITKSGYAKLADFGLAKLDDTPGVDEAVTRTDIRTRPGTIVGTAAYMAPEQAAGRRVDARSDVFSFGVVLHELLGGRRPFTGESETDVLHAVLHDQAAPLPASVPAALRTIVDKALEKDPANRFQSMRDMVVDLRRLTRSSEEELSAPATARATRARRYVGAALTLSALAIAAIAWWASRSHQAGAPRPQEYTKLTNFADSVTSPALSPDGRMLTFIRGNSTFFGEGQVYVKLLTDGEPVRLTNDDLRKMSPKFSPDGARIAYSTTSIDFTRFETWVVPVLGGQPQKLLANAEGMTWIAQPRAQSGSQPLVLFSELTGRGPQMSIVASTESRAAQRSVYAPPLEVGGMAHRSVASPDGRSVIVIEMDFRSWLPCRLVPFDGSSTGTPVGPAPAQCTDAAWSPDGKWMYFSANTGTDGVHTWRQRFPNGTPEQITFGVTDEEGIHVAPDARSFVTSIGTSQSTVWIHDANGDRQMTSEGFSYLPSIAADGKKLFYLVRSGGVRNWHAGALWVADLQSGQRQRVLPDFLMQNYRISEDSRRVVFTAVDGTGHTPLWLASLDGDTPPRRLATLDAILPSFGAPGTIVFGSQDPAYPFLYQVREDGGDPQPFVPVPMLMPFAVSPGGRLVTVMDVQRFGAVVVFKAGSSDSIKLCDACTEPQGTDPIPPPLSWTPDGRFVYFRFSKSMYAIPLPPGQLLPPIPPSGFASEDAVAALPGAKLLSREAIYPGPKPSLYAFTKLATQRNIYRVPVP